MKSAVLEKRIVGQGSNGLAGPSVARLATSRLPSPSDYCVG